VVKKSEKDKIGGAYGMNGEDDNSVQNFSRKTLREESGNTGLRWEDTGNI
jgi:hypothetical protein